MRAREFERIWGRPSFPIQAWVTSYYKPWLRPGSERAVPRLPVAYSRCVARKMESSFSLQAGQAEVLFRTRSRALPGPGLGAAAFAKTEARSLIEPIGHRCRWTGRPHRTSSYPCE